MSIPVLYEDNHLLVVEKPVNVPVQEDSSKDKDLLNILKGELKVRHHKPGNVFLGLVHRLDRPVGGVIAFGKTSKAASRLSDAIRRKDFDRDYLAVVRGTPEKKSGLLEHYLYKDTTNNKVHAVTKNHRQAKKSILEYELLGTKDELSLLKVKLHTGRSHQIRVQLAESNLPIYGDQKYGQYVNRPGQQIALWAHTLSFPHTTKEEKLTFTSEPPREYPWNLWTKSTK